MKMKAVQQHISPERWILIKAIWVGFWKNHEKKSYIYRQTSKEDGRAYHLFLTDAGKLRARDFIEKSNQEIGDIIATLSYSEQK